jgi:hypothetical protein
MNIRTIHRRPWTCRFGRFGVTIEQLGPETSRVDDVFWACHRPAAALPLKVTTRDECENCPWWEPTRGFERKR